MDAQIFLDNFGTIADAPGGVDRLRELILDLAVRGQLVDQDPAEGSARDLLQLIEADRKRETVSGVRRRTKTAGSEIDPPHSIPASWAWCRLSDIAVYNGRAKVPASRVPSDAWVLDLEDIEKSSSKLLHRASCAERRPTSTKTAFESGDVLFGKLRPYLDKVLIADSDGYATTEIVPIVPLRGVRPEWVRLSLKSPRFRRFVDDVSYGMKMPRLGTKDAESSVHPLPPNAEQVRIVAKVDELMQLCDDLEAHQQARHHVTTRLRASSLDALTTAETDDDLHTAWSRIHTTWESLTDHPDSIDDLRRTILDLAIRGRLFSSSTRYEPDRAHPNRPSLHSGWTWRSLGELLEDGLTNGWSPKAADYETNIKSLKLSATTSGSFNGSKVKYLDVELDPKSKYWLQPNDLLIQRSNTPEYVGMAALYTGQPGEFIFPDLMMRGRVRPEHCPEYIHLALIAPTTRRVLQSLASGTSQSMVKLSQGAVTKVLLPVPPLDEQRSIASRVVDLLACCDDLQRRLVEQGSMRDRVAAALLSA